VRVGGFVVTAALLEGVILVERLTVPETLRLFVAKPVVGNAHAVGVRVTVTVAQEDGWPLTLMVRLTVVEELVDWLMLKDVVKDEFGVCIGLGLPSKEPERVGVRERVFDAHPDAEGV
jgi:hypothetical protein